MKSTTRSICLFGLSADPPTGTGGHVGMVQALQTFFRNEANETDTTSSSKQPQQQQHTILIAPVYRHTFASKRNRLETFDHRLAMTRLAFDEIYSQDDDDHVRILVSDIERQAFDWAMQQQQQQRSSDDGEQNQVALSFGTATLLDYLRSSTTHDFDWLDGGSDETTTLPTTRYSLALGADTFCDLMHGKWKESQRVLQLVDQLFVFARKDGSSNDDGDSSNCNTETTTTTPLQECLRMAGPRAILLEVDHLEGVSSSMARDCSDLDKLRNMVPEAVVQYILEHGLYAIGKQRQRDE